MLQVGGGALSIDATAACPVGASGQESCVNVLQGQALGRSFYVPVRDGRLHTFAIGVTASQGQFQPGTADGLTFAFVEAGGQAFSGVDENTRLRLRRGLTGARPPRPFFSTRP
jgi:hypothetical protein